MTAKGSSAEINGDPGTGQRRLAAVPDFLADQNVTHSITSHCADTSASALGAAVSISKRKR